MDPITIYMLAVSPGLVVLLWLAGVAGIVFSLIRFLTDKKFIPNIIYVSLLCFVLGVLVPTPESLTEAQSYLETKDCPSSCVSFTDGDAGND